ncbi:hypothetical protein B0H16DRAFT_1473343 [Mycena metata]|uniref:Uncharacterized protein n=1 Tax=Mycena metata TaxID=1033252 RepID=A0AAD7MM80_9AGAR|nr:hypothetical protein B0H16DRAFT_1473343 [Mycena metata]
MPVMAVFALLQFKHSIRCYGTHGKNQNPQIDFSPAITHFDTAEVNIVSDYDPAPNGTEDATVDFIFLSVGVTLPSCSSQLTYFTVFSIAVGQNIITTGLMGWHLWHGKHHTKSQHLGGRMPILHILVKSTALYLMVEILLEN